MKPKTLEIVYACLFIYRTVWTSLLKLFFVDGNGVVICVILRICPQRDQVYVYLNVSDVSNGWEFGVFLNIGKIMAFG